MNFQLKKNKFLAWLLVVSMFFTMFLPGMTVSYADGGALTPQAGNEETLVTPEQSGDVDQAEVSDGTETTNTGISEPSSDLDSSKETGTDVDAGAETGTESGTETGVEKDTEAPTITVVGLDKQEVSQSELTFKVTVTDNVNKDIIPEVKLNTKVINGVAGEYKVSLNVGENLIKVTAIDGAENKAEQTFSIKYNKVVPTLSAKEQLAKNLEYIHNTVPSPSYGSEWSILSLARGDYQADPAYYDSYYEKVKLKVKEVMLKNNGKLDKTLSTEESRVILGLTSMGVDIHNVGGYDLTKSLANIDYVKGPYTGSISALLALDSHHYEIPLIEGGNSEKQTTREKLIRKILDEESKLSGLDMKAMALQSLAPYYSNYPEVRSFVDRTIEYFSQSQRNDGSFPSNIFSTAQVIVALTALGIDPATDSRFIKNGKSALDGLLMSADPRGGFIYSGDRNAMATDQGTYALVSYDRLVNKKNRLFDMTDVQIKDSSQPELPQAVELPLPNGEQQPNVAIPNDNHDYIIPIKPTDSNKDIKVSILESIRAKVSVNVPFNSSLPNLEVTKGNAVAAIPKGAKVTSGNSAAIEVLTSKSVVDTALINQVKAIIPSDKKLDHIDQAFSMGGSDKVSFDSFVTLTFKGMKGKDTAYIQAGNPHAIQKYASNIEGEASGKSEYAYDSGNDLIVKTNHFTDYVVYTSITDVPPVVAGQYVTLTVDKLMINKGYVVANTKVELRSGDTVWTLLRRVLDSKGISYSWNNKSGTPYLESIAGDGEFDHGSGSGWMYSVNGSYPGYGASQYVLTNGDEVQWRYTANLGSDLGAKVPTGSLISVGEGMVVNSDDKSPVINVPSNIQRDYKLSISKELQNTNNITINIPDVKAKVFLNLEDVKDNIPMITVNKGNIVVVIDKGTRFKSGDRQIELMTANQDTKLQEMIQSTLNKGNKVTALNYAFMMGNTNSSVLFDKPLTITIKGAKGQMIGFVDNNRFTPITIYDTEDQGIKQNQGSEKQTYGFVKGNDIYIKTNHITTFVSYTTGLDATVPTEPSTTPNLNTLYSDSGAFRNGLTMLFLKRLRMALSKEAMAGLIRKLALLEQNSPKC
ncbi:DUF4430 domain-containing protein [Paenibacillus pini]|uniref:Transcobalamin-like C-terminal domain-containing protein n=1 Tax=Paenibacillus pini JCM 16418 TaxID=1236976 RepID=W7YMI2_9BACL|nr:DUF4430 domain-containing protein [Paenibacillus pini]GAF08828.1 hypothetical protein JCM16418_2935 [Paenibacillus pini JCM 16418]